MTYRPPLLPDYFARTHTLEVIIGVPTEEQVEAIHHAIRAVNSVSNVPALYDSGLSTHLAQYLFTIQMAVYRNKYPLNVFPGENTYTPPSVPSHIPISLQPIVSAPSDGELELAHNAVRTLENLANSPFFDSTLSARLSQHVFNIQFARYIRDSNQGHFTPLSTNNTPQSQPNESGSAITASGNLPDMVDQQTLPATSTFAPEPSAPTTSPTTLPSQVTPQPCSIAESNDKLDQICAAVQETNHLLGRNGDLLKVIERTLASTYYSAHQGRNSYQILNEKGEIAWMHKLPCTSAGMSHDGPALSHSNIPEQTLVVHLGFYNIGAGLVEPQTGNLMPGKMDDAKSLLARYLYYGYIS